jgi:hypothetical protein
MRLEAAATTTEPAHPARPARLMTANRLAAPAQPAAGRSRLAGARSNDPWPASIDAGSIRVRFAAMLRHIDQKQSPRWLMLNGRYADTTKAGSRGRRANRGPRCISAPGSMLSPRVCAAPRVRQYSCGCSTMLTCWPGAAQHRRVQGAARAGRARAVRAAAALRRDGQRAARRCPWRRGAGRTRRRADQATRRPLRTYPESARTTRVSAVVPDPDNLRIAVSPGTDSHARLHRRRAVYHRVHHQCDIHIHPGRLRPAQPAAAGPRVPSTAPGRRWHGLVVRRPPTLSAARHG